MILDNFIVFEGLDGAGTTTQAEELRKEIESLGKSVYLTHEPTDNYTGKNIRKVLQKKENVTPLSLALMYSSDRADHLYSPSYGIINHLKKGEVVILDRYIYSSFAYQSVTCNKEYIKRINSIFPEPRYVIFLDTSPENCVKRIEKRGEEKELFDTLDYLSKVRANYKEYFSTLDNEIKFIQLDGNKTKEEIQKEVWKEIKKSF